MTFSIVILVMWWFDVAFGSLNVTKSKIQIMLIHRNIQTNLFITLYHNVLVSDYFAFFFERLRKHATGFFGDGYQLQISNNLKSLFVDSI